MKAKLLSILAILGISLASAQIDFGIKASLIANKFKVESFDSELESYESGDSKLGAQLGIYTKIKIATFFVQPEALFTHTKGEISLKEEGLGESVLELDYNRLEVPVMVGMEILNFLKLYAGPSFALNLNSDVKIEGTYDEVSDRYKDSTMGYQVGIGVEIARLQVDIRYGGSLSAISDGYEIDGTFYESDERSDAVYFGVGYKL
jgi:opacity protein-like surface antigen